MDRYELMDRAGIEIPEEDYQKIEVVYLASPDFEVVGDVVDYIKAHKGSYKGLLERFNDAMRIHGLTEDYKILWNERSNIIKQKEEIEAQLIDSRREVREKEKVIEYLCSLLSTEEILAGTDMDKTKIAQFAALYKGVA